MLPIKPYINHIITRIFWVVLIMGASPFSMFAQKDATPVINIPPTQASTAEIIKLLEDESGWTISYSSRLCIKDQTFVPGNEKTLLAHLNDLFSNCPFDYILRDNRLILQPKEPKVRKFIVSGFVKETGTNETLPSANIYNPATYRGTISNNYGYFSITLPKGSHQLSASYVGFQQQTKTINLQNDTTINYYLTPSLRLNEVDIYGEKYYSQINATRLGKIFLPVGDIKNPPSLLGETDLVKSIQTIPGIQGGSEGFSGLYVRGGGPDQNLILLDDVPVYNIGHLLGFFSIFNTEAVKHVSVLKGGFPARYGGRLSSVIDIKMHEGNNERIEGTISLGLLSSGISINGPISKNKTGFALSFRRTYMDAIGAIIQHGQDESTNYYFYDINAKINHTFNPKNRIYLSAYMGRDKYYTSYNFIDIPVNNINGQPGENNITINDENDAGWGNFVTALRWNHIFNARLFSNLTATYSDYNFFIGVERNNEINSVWDSFEQRYQSGVNDISLKIDFDYYPANNHLVKFGANVIRHEFNPGVDIIQRSLDTSQPLDTTIGDTRVIGNEYHAYIEDEFTIANRLRLNLGSRFVIFHEQGNNSYSFEPRASLNFKLLPNLNIRSSYSEMSQYIHLVSSSNVTLPTDLWLPVTEKIPPLYSNQVSLGSDWQITADNHYSFSFDVYYKKLKNLLHYRQSTGFFDYSTQWEDKLTSGEGKSKGIEMTLQKNNGDLTGWVGYTLAKTTNTFSELNNGQPFPARFDRRHDIHLNLNYRFNQNVDGSLTWQFGSGTPITLPSEKFYAPDFPFSKPQTRQGFSEYAPTLNEFRMPAFHRLDVGFNFYKEREKTSRTWSAGIINVYGRQNPFLLYFETPQDPDPGMAQRNLKQLSLFPFPIPYIRYTLNF